MTRTLMPRSTLSWILTGIAAVVFAGLFYQIHQNRQQQGAPFAPSSLHQIVRHGAALPGYQAQFVSEGQAAYVHAPTAVVLPNGRIRAFWYGGSREGASDVSIRSAAYDPNSRKWQNETVVLSRADLSRGLNRYIRKLGNPVAYYDPIDGQLYLMVVSTSIGGWSTSAINFLVSVDEGASWSSMKRLITSPLFNLSTLVKGAVVRHADDSLGLPVYHEAFGVFGEYLRVTRDGKVLDKSRLASGRYSLQPVIVPLDEQSAVGFMRYKGAPPKRVLITHSTDHGRSWQTPEKLALPNPNAAVAVLSLAADRLLMILNDSTSGRHKLSLAVSEDHGENWRVIHDLENDQSAAKQAKYAYPWVVQGRDHDIHVFYSWRNKAIKHVRFTSSWLAKRVKP